MQTGKQGWSDNHTTIFVLLAVCVDLSNRAEKSVISYNLRKLNIEG
jgi:hypothetical protein